MSSFNLSYPLTYMLLVTSSVIMLLERYVKHIEKASLVFFFLIGIVALINLLVKRKPVSKPLAFLLIPTLVGGVIYSAFTGTISNYVLQIVIVFSSLLPLLLIRELEHEQLLRLAKLLLFLAFIQLLFDVFLPDPEHSNLDKYTGTFQSGNDKTRFLILILIFFVYRPALFLKRNAYGYIIKAIYVTAVSISIYIGFSMFAYLTFFASIAASIFFKRLAVFLTLSILLSYGVIYAIYNSDYNTKTRSQVTFLFHRYFDEDHGVAAVYKYGGRILAENNYVFGVGLGNWVSRSGQLLKSSYLKDNPSTMIAYGTLYTTTAAPGGLSAYYVLLVEFGLIFLPVLILFNYLLFNLKSKTIVGLISFYYIFFIINYYPFFFEFQSLSYLFLSTYIIFNRLIK